MAKGNFVMKRSDLVKVVEEINNLVGLSPSIEVLKEDRIKDIKTKIKEWESELFTNDPWSDFALTIFKEIGLTLQIPPSEKAAEERKATEKKKKKKKATEESATEESEKATEKKKKKKKATEESEKATEERKKKEHASPTRPRCVAEVLKDMKKGQTISIQEWTKEADSRYVSDGGSSNLKQTELLVNRALSFLIPLDLASIEGEIVSTRLSVTICDE